jgi:hypothetical protein
MKKIFSWGILYLFFIFLIIILNSCGKTSNPVSPETKIEIGDFTKIATQNVGTGGSKIVYTNPSDSLSGLTIEVPNAAFKSSRTFEISQAPIKKNNFGNDFLPLTPVIRVSNGGGYSDSIMTMEIPIKLPEGYFPMAFYYDSETGELEGIPPGAVTANKIYVGTCHFDGKNLSDGKMPTIQATQNWADIIVAAVKLDELNGEYDSGFKPGVDDWEFTNWGSYIAPGGFCVGACLTETYYYYVKKLKENKSRLYGLYDEAGNGVPDKNWQDNPKGIRFASAVHKDYDVNFNDKNQQFGWRAKFLEVGLKKFTKDSLDYLSFLYSLKILKKPQLCDICCYGGSVGHVITIYKAGNGILNVADPNYPGITTRQIEFVQGNFKPYNTGSDAAHLGILFDEICYFAKTAYIDFAQVEQRWKEFDNNTIGNGTFPDVQIQYKDEKGNWLTLPEFLFTNSDSVVVRALCNTCIDGYKKPFPPDQATEIMIVGENGDTLENMKTISYPVISLKTSDYVNKKIGVVVAGFPAMTGNNSYITFQWLTISKQVNLTLESAETDGSPIKKAGVKDKNYTFKLNSQGALKDNFKIEWNFGDGSSTETKTKDTTIQHTFSKDGTYNINAKVYDNNSGGLIGEAKETAKIKSDSDTVSSDLVSILIQTLDIYTEVYMGKFNRDTKTVYDDNNIKSSESKEQLADLLLNSLFYTNNVKLSWTKSLNILKFRLSGDEADDYYFYSTNYTGEIDTNSMTILNVTGSRMRKAKKVNPNGTSDSTVITFKLKNLPVEKTYNQSYEIFFCVRFEYLPKDVMNYVDEISKVEYRYDGIDNSDSKKRGMYTTIKQSFIALPVAPTSYMRLWFVKQK